MAKLNITVARGADWSKVLTFKDKNGAAIDISSSTFSGAMKKKDGTTLSDFSFSLDSDGTDGKVRATISSTETLLQTKPGAYHYDIYGSLLSREYRILYGDVDFQLNITERP